jgi:hypothetical protein
MEEDTDDDLLDYEPSPTRALLEFDTHREQFIGRSLMGKTECPTVLEDFPRERIFP